jgi:hypothetical protein
MGGAVEWPRLSGSSRASCRVGKLTFNTKFSHRRLHRTSKDERTAKTAHLKPVCSNGSYTSEGFRRTGTRRISSWPGNTSPHNRSDTDADFFIHQLFPSSQTADHTFRKLHDELADKPTLQAPGLIPQARTNPLTKSQKVHERPSLKSEKANGKWTD